MMMDIGCPAEMLGFERADYGEGRQLAYLTFLNESSDRIEAVSGRLVLLDAAGRPIADRRIAFGDLSAAPEQTFTCTLSLEGEPPFDGAEMIIEDVMFEGGASWAMHPLRLKDYAPPVLPDGPARNALIAVAGHDAVCYPALTEEAWLCVCGRYNRRRWPACRRCRRMRDTVLADFTPEQIDVAFQEKMQAAQQNPPRVIMDGAARKKARAAREEAARPKQEEKARPPVARWVIEGVIIVAVLGVLIWGGSKVIGRLSQPLGTDGQPGQAPVDYLEPIR